MTTSFKMKLFRDNIDVDDLPEITCDDVVASNPVVIRDRQNVNEVKVSYSHVDEIIYRYLFVATAYGGTVTTFELGDYSKDTGTVIDSVKYDIYPQAGFEASQYSQIIHSSGDIYVIVYRSRNQFNYIQTLSIDDDGIITLIEDCRINNCAYSGGVIKTSPGHFITPYVVRYGPTTSCTFTVNNEGKIDIIIRNSSEYMWSHYSCLGGVMVPGCATQDYICFSEGAPWPRIGKLCSCRLPPYYYIDDDDACQVTCGGIEPANTAAYGRIARVYNLPHFGYLDVHYYQRMSPNRLTMYIPGHDTKTDVYTHPSVDAWGIQAIGLDGYPKVGIIYHVGATLHIKTYIIYIEEIHDFWAVRLIDADHKTFSVQVSLTEVLIHKNKNKYLIASGGLVHTIRIGNDGEISDIINTLSLGGLISSDILKIRDH